MLVGEHKHNNKSTRNINKNNKNAWTDSVSNAPLAHMLVIRNMPRNLATLNVL